MGQSQSQSQSESPGMEETSKETPPPPPPSSSSSSSSSSSNSSLESLIAEAAAYGDDDNQSIDAKAAKALQCPCIADLRKGPCGPHFSEAFLCFLKSTAQEKGSDCVNPFVALQSCIKANPNAFPKDVEQVSDKEVSSSDQRIIPPTWAVDSQNLKPRL